MANWTSENDKDWNNPVFMKIYAGLAPAGIIDGIQDEITSWLNNNGFCNLTCCPMCHVDDFVHVQGCYLGEMLDKVHDNLLKNKGSLMAEVMHGLKKATW